MRCRQYGRWHQGHKRARNPFSVPMGARLPVPTLARPGKATAGPVTVPAFRGKVTMHLFHKSAKEMKKVGPVITVPTDMQLPEADKVLCAVPRRDKRISRSDHRSYMWKQFHV